MAAMVLHASLANAFVVASFGACAEQSGRILGSGSLAMSRVASAAECCNLCSERPDCLAYTFATDSNKCYLKDNAKDGGAHANRVSGAVSRIPDVIRAAVDVEAGAPQATISPHFVGVNADWWIDGCGGEGEKWDNNASVRDLDLSNVRLRMLASALAGGTFRVGGTHEDDVIYEVGDVKCPSPAKACYPVCLSMDRWRSISEFAASAGLQLAFGLNVKVSELTNILDLLNYTKLHRIAVDTFELGNELGLGYIERHGSRIAAAVHELWPEKSQRPSLVGPDDAGDPGRPLEFAKLIREQDYLEAITFHAYPFHHGGPPDAQLIDGLVDPVQLDKGILDYVGMVSQVKNASRANYTPQLWMGEGNSAGSGGRLGITNSFANSFWYLHAMGSAAGLGIQRFLRQALVGGEYELVDRSTFHPNPDYFAALLWRRIIGTRVLATNFTAAAQPHLRLHAFCAQSSHPSMRALGVEQGDVAVLVLNFHRTAHGELTLANIPGARLTWAVRSALPCVIASPAVELRSAAGWTSLALDAAGQLPELMPILDPAASPLLLEPLSYAFSIVRGAKAAACEAIASVV